MIAAKYIDDSYYYNNDYAKIGGVSNKEINALEAEMIKLLNFELHVTAEKFEKYKDQLIMHLEERIGDAKEHLVEMECAAEAEIEASKPKPANNEEIVTFSEVETDTTSIRRENLTLKKRTLSKNRTNSIILEEDSTDEEAEEASQRRKIQKYAITTGGGCCGHNDISMSEYFNDTNESSTPNTSQTTDTPLGTTKKIRINFEEERASKVCCLSIKK